MTYWHMIILTHDTYLWETEDGGLVGMVRWSYYQPILCELSICVCLIWRHDSSVLVCNYSQSMFNLIHHAAYVWLWDKLIHWFGETDYDKHRHGLDLGSFYSLAGTCWLVCNYCHSVSSYRHNKCTDQTLLLVSNYCHSMINLIGFM